MCSAHLDLYQLWELWSTSRRKRTPSLRWFLVTMNSTNSCVISVNCTQVSKNGKHLPQFCRLQYTLSARDNDDANSNLETLKENGPRTSEHNLHNKWDLRAVLGSRKTKGWMSEMSFEPVSYCDLAQNLETVRLLISKKDHDRHNDEYPIIHKGICNSLFSFQFCRYSWWLTQTCQSYYS